MALSETQDVTKPAGSRDRSLGDDDIREFKRAEAERSNEDHIRPADESGENNVGHHRTITMAVVETSDPSNEANIGKLYLKDISSKIELHFIDEDGDVIIMTKGGKLAVLGAEGWRSGDMLLSSSTDTPTGWTDVSTTYDNKFIRIGDDTPLTTTGGADTHTHAAGSYAAPAHDHGGATGGVTFGGGGADTAGTLDTKHYHSITEQAAATITGTSATASNVPAYIQVRMYKKD